MKIIDLHQDIATNALYATGKDISQRYSLSEGIPQVPGFAPHNNTDIPRLKEGNVKLVFSVIFALDRSSVEDLSSLDQEDYDFEKMIDLKFGLEAALEQLAYYHDVVENTQEGLIMVKSLVDYQEVLADNKIGFLLHLEGMDYMDEELELLDSFYKLGVRSVSMTWRNKNALAAGNNVEGGLTDAGRRLIRKTKEQGIVLDLAHANKQTFWESVDIIDFPFMVSHTLCNEIQRNSRNLTDDQIRAVADRGGVIGLAAIPDFIGGEDTGDTISEYVDHFEHVVSLVGEDHVAFGTDFDGLIDPKDRFIKDFEDSSKYGNVIAEMKTRGWSQSALEKIAFRNVERLLEATLT